MLNALYFAVCSIFWGGSFIAIKIMLQEVPSSWAAFYRIAFSLIFLSIIYHKHLKWPKDLTRKEWAYTAIVGLCQYGLPFCFLFWGELYVSAGIAGVINGTYPFWALLFGLTVFKTVPKVTPRKVIGLIFGLVGIILIFSPQFEFEAEKMQLLGLGSVTLMAVCYGIATNVIKKLESSASKVSLQNGMLIQQLISVVFLFVVATLWQGPIDITPLKQPQIALSLFYLAFCSTCLAFICFYQLIKNVGTVTASLTTFFVPLVALILDVIIYSRYPLPVESIGTLVILCSIIFLRGKNPPPEKKPT